MQKKYNNGKKSPIIKYTFLFILLNIVDKSLTFVALTFKNGVELNPFVKSLFGTTGFFGTFLITSLYGGVCLYVMNYVSMKYSEKKRKYIFWAFISTVICVVIYGCISFLKI